LTAATLPTRVLVTGSAGFLGGALARTCRTLWPEALVVGVDRRPPDLVCDLADAAAALDLMRETRPDTLFHFAGLTGHASWEGLWRANVLTLANVLDAALVHAPHCAVVVPGSAAEYGDVEASSGAILESFPSRPRTPYAVSKAWQTTLARNYSLRGLHVTVGRLFNLCGAGVPATLVLGAVAEQLRGPAASNAALIVRVGDVRAVRDFLDVDDACAAFAALALRGRSGEEYNLCSGSPRVVGDVVRRMIELSGMGATLKTDDAGTAGYGVSWSLGDNRKLCAETGWQPGVSLDDSLRRMLS
jgi:GDP-4-dehydro-6-deoxy-D-mannose reductase